MVTLYYFDARGVSEPIRMILSYAGVKFEDNRSPLPGLPAILPPEIKERTTWGQVPMLEFDGKKLHQSLAIARYLARKHNLVPEDLYQAALCDEYVDACKDFMNVWFGVLIEEDSKKKEEKRQEAVVSTKKKYLDVFEGIVKANGGKHLVGDSLTWADIFLAYTIDHTAIENEVILMDDNYTALKSLSENVFATPGIKEWMEKRPKTLL